MSVSIYLGAEDEITAAVARIRALSEAEAVLVLSRGSRIGTSRINFKLLAREAHAAGVNLVAVSDEPTVRALAVSAGLPAYESVAAAQDALQHFRQQDQQLAQRSGRLPGAPRSRSEDVSAPASRGSRPADGSSLRLRPASSREATRVLEVPGLPSAGRSARRAPEAPASAVAEPAGDRRTSRGRLPLAALLTLGLIAVLVAAGLYAAYLYLPTATISLRPMTQPLGPLEVRVTADPSVAVPDPQAGIIPAERIRLPLAVSGEFPATGVEVTREPATGTVRFTSENTLFDVPIPAGTVVATENGIEFETTRSVTVPRASFATGPTRASAPIQARSPGSRGNVDAAAISEVPRDLANALISVTNPRPTSGGARLEQLVVTQEDYDGALEELTEQLTEELQQRLDDPATTPRGLTLFPSSVLTEEPRSQPLAAELVGSPAESFRLALATTASVSAVNEALVGQVAAERLRASLGPGRALVGDEVATSYTAGLPLGSTVVYRASASAQVYVEPDREALLDSVRGKPISEAQAILEQHGTAEIAIWPDIVDRLPEQVARINLTIMPPREDP